MQPYKHINNKLHEKDFLLYFAVWLIYHLLYGHKFSWEVANSLVVFEFSDIFTKLKRHKR